MNWPFRRSVARQREQLLELRLKDLEQQLAHEREQTTYFRTRYERIADELLFSRGQIAAPVHVESKTSTKEPVTNRLLRIANITGSARGVDFQRAPDRGPEPLPTP